MLDEKTNCLSYYMSKSSIQQSCRGTVNLTVAEVQVDPNDNCQIVIKDPVRTMYMRAETLAERQRWLMAMSHVAENFNKRIEEREMNTTLGLLSKKMDELTDARKGVLRSLGGVEDAFASACGTAKELQQQQVAEPVSAAASGAAGSSASLASVSELGSSDGLNGAGKPPAAGGDKPSAKYSPAMLRRKFSDAVLSPARSRAKSVSGLMDALNKQRKRLDDAGGDFAARGEVMVGLLADFLALVDMQRRVWQEKYDFEVAERERVEREVDAMR